MEKFLTRLYSRRTCLVETMLSFFFFFLNQLLDCYSSKTGLPSILQEKHVGGQGRAGGVNMVFSKFSDFCVFP